MEKLSFYRDLADYVKVIDLMFTSYVRTDDFANESEEDRCTIVDCCTELKDFIGDLIKEEKPELSILNTAQNN